MQTKLQEAIQAQDAGNLDLARGFYVDILVEAPNDTDANYHIGNLVMQRGNATLALPFLKRAVEGNYKQEKYWISYVTALIKDGQINSALSILSYAKKLELSGLQFDLLEKKAQDLFITSKKEEKSKVFAEAIRLREWGKYKEAQECLNNYLKNDPDVAEGWSLLSHVLLAAGQDSEAEAAQENAESINPTLASVQRMRARILLKQSKPKEALMAITETINNEKKNSETALVYASCLIANNKEQEALDAIEKSLKINPEYPEALALRSLIRITRQDLSGAICDLKIAVLYKPHLLQAWRVLASAYQQSDHLLKAIRAYEMVVRLAPNSVPDMLALVAVLSKTKNVAATIPILETACKLEPLNSDIWLNMGEMWLKLNNGEKAKIAFEKYLEIIPRSPVILNQLGLIELAASRWESARKYFERAANIDPTLTKIQLNLAYALQKLGNLAEAKARYEIVLTLQPDHADTYNNLANVFSALGLIREAQENYRLAILNQPDHAEAYSNLGISLQKDNQFEEAESCYRRALSINPRYSKVHNNLGLILKGRGLTEEAAASFKQAIDHKPDYLEAHENFGDVLTELGHINKALAVYIAALELPASEDIKLKLASLLGNIVPGSWNKKLAEIISKALLEAWTRPTLLMGAACRLLNLEPEFKLILQRNDQYLYGDQNDSFLEIFIKNSYDFSSLLRAMLLTGPINDYQIERLLISLRKHFLTHVSLQINANHQDTDVDLQYCYLAEQCFINEYVYVQTQDEIVKSQELLDRLSHVTKNEGEIPVSWIVALACYMPLSSIVNSEHLTHRVWPQHIERLLKQQIREPLIELSLRDSIPKLTDTENQVSLDVQQMYQENPYPRWREVKAHSRQINLNNLISNLVASRLFEPLVDDSHPTILCAGCGTGQHPINTAQIIRGASVLAIDLSIVSLAYAKRKTEELDLHNIEYAQADILNLGSLGQAFDVIESVGVLHHLEDPFKGWSVLLSLLKPHGLMKLGFYSEFARKGIVQIREIIAKEAIGSSPSEIRSFRKRLLESPDLVDFGFATSVDMFALSTCRDLLFHVQEHRMTIPVLSSFLERQNLRFLGFHLDRSVIRSYARRFPEDPDATNLTNWHEYEQEYPDTFKAMYQFWVQKIN